MPSWNQRSNESIIMGNCSNISNTQAVSLTAGTLTSGFCHTSLQTTYEEFINRTTAQLSQSVAGFVAGDETPNPNDQNKLWFKLDPNSCYAPLGWYYWNGTDDWLPVKTPVSSLADNTQGDIIYYGASGAPAVLNAGTDGYYLKTRGANQNPEWAEVPSPTITIESSNVSLGNDTTVSSIPSGAFLMIGTMKFTMTANTGARAHAHIKESDGTLIDEVILGAGNEGNGQDGGSGMTVRDSFTIGLPSNAASVRIYKGGGNNSMTGEVTQFVKYA